MTQDDRMETITDPAAIRASDEPDPFRRNPVAQTGPDDPWRFTRFVADDHECVIVRDEYDEPAPFGSCSTHRRALSSPVALGCTTSARVGAAVALDLDAIEADALAALNPSRCRCTVQSGSVYSSQCPRHDPRDPGYRAPWQMPPATALALVAEVRRLTSHADGLSANLGGDLIAWAARAESAEAEVVTLRARLAAMVDEYPHADTCGSMLTPGAGYPCSCWQADLRAALATTGEGE